MESQGTYWQNHSPLRKTGINDLARQAVQILKEKKAKTILDLGSGQGFDSAFFVDEGFEVTAADVAPSNIEHLEELVPAESKARLHTAVADFSEPLPFHGQEFDAVYAHLSLHYFNDAVTTRIFKEIRNLLKKDGLLFVACKSPNDPLYGKGEKIGPDTFQADHIRHFFSEEYMREKLAEFRNIAIKEYTAEYNQKQSAILQAIAQK